MTRGHMERALPSVSEPTPPRSSDSRKVGRLGKIKVSALAECISPTETRVAMRHHRLTLDEPVAMGGVDAGAAPLELLAASLTGCTNVIMNRIASDLGLRLSDGKIGVTLELDERVLSGSSVRTAFPKVMLNISATCNASPEQLEILKSRLAACCPVSVLFRRAGSEVIESWRINDQNL